MKMNPSAELEHCFRRWLTSAPRTWHCVGPDETCLENWRLSAAMTG